MQSRHELEDTYWHEFLVWCAMPPETEKSSELIFWIDYHFPLHENFWEWMLRFKKDLFKPDYGKV